MEIILLLCFIGCFYGIYKINKYTEIENHTNYINIQDQLKQLNDEYVNGKYDFKTYKYKKDNLYISNHLPVDYKEDLN